MSDSNNHKYNCTQSTSTSVTKDVIQYSQCYQVSQPHLGHELSLNTPTDHKNTAWLMVNWKIYKFTTRQSSYNLQIQQAMWVLCLIPWT